MCSLLITFSLVRLPWSDTAYRYSCGLPQQQKHSFLNRCIRAPNAAAVTIKVNAAKEFSEAKPLLTFVVCGLSMLSLSIGFSHVKSDDLILWSKPWTLALAPTALFKGTDQRADEMQLDCISETLMVALFYRSCFLRRLGLWPDQGLKVGAYSPLGSSYIPLLKGVRGGQLFMFFNDEWMNKRKKKEKEKVNSCACWYMGSI